MQASQTLSAPFNSSACHTQKPQLSYQGELEHLLKLIFKGLVVSQQGKKKRAFSDRSSEGRKAISREIFTKFSELPELVAYALFRAFDQQQQGELTQSAFVAGFTKLLFGNVKQKLALVFQILQLPNHYQDNQIRERECLTLLYHMGISCGCYISGFHQNKSHRPEPSLASHTDIDNALESLFSSGSSSTSKRKSGRMLSFDKFYQFSVFREADISVMVLSFLYDKIRLVPMLSNYLMLYEEGSHSGSLEENQSNSLLLETHQLYRLNDLARIRYLRNLTCIKKLFTPHSCSNALNCKAIYSFEKSKSLDSPPPGEASLLSQLGVKEKKIPIIESDPLSKWKVGFSRRKEAEQTRSQAWYSGHVFRFVDKSTIRLFWYELRGSQLYFFNKAKSPAPKMIIPLREGFLLENNEQVALSPREAADLKLTSFNLVFPSGFKKEFIFEDKAEKQEWMDALGQVIGHFDFDRDYEITSPATSLPGQISLNGFSFKNGESLVLTQIPKQGDSSLSQSQQLSYSENLRTSLEVLKLCSHPLLPRVLEIRHTANYTYVARQPCDGGDLPSYLEQTTLTPRVALHLISQMTEILCFFKKMSISIANLSLSSFSLANQIAPSDSKTLPQLRLTNLKDARILSEFSKNDSSSFNPYLGSAPEILKEADQINFQADVFSFGVVLCDLLFGKLPFSSFKEILEEEPSITQQECSLGSTIRTNIKKLLVRDPQERGTIQGFSRLIQFLN